MLVQFSVTNFRSFGEEVTLNMVASNKLPDHENHRIPINDTGKHVLRAAVIYGANAAGKSNLVKAMDVAQQMVCDSGDRRPTVTPFRFSEGKENEPSSFEFRFLIGSRVFVFGFDILHSRFTSEWLCVIKGEDEIPLFERNAQGAIEVFEATKKLFPDDVETYNALSVLRQIPIRKEQLFLNRALSIPSSSQGKTLRAILKWFTTDLIVLPANSRSSRLVDRLHKDKGFRSFCSKFMDNVGTGIGGFEIAATEREVSDWERRFFEQFQSSGVPQPHPYGEEDTDISPKPDNPGLAIVRKLYSEHLVTPKRYYLPFSEESDGTQSLLHIMPILAAPPDETRVVVMDELDRSLHPLICWEFVRFFSESCPGARKQLIVTTHEAHLLNQELLRRDEYWFAEKDERQQTKLVSLVDFNIRNDLKVEKGYLKGRFGAIPLIGGMHNLEKLLECKESEESHATEEPPA